MACAWYEVKVLASDLEIQCKHLCATNTLRKSVCVCSSTIVEAQCQPILTTKQHSIAATFTAAQFDSITKSFATAYRHSFFATFVCALSESLVAAKFNSIRDSLVTT
jgi:hypothetical protein